MAGLYPDAPSRRMAYDADGTLVFNSDYIDQGLTRITAPWNEELGGVPAIANAEDPVTNAWQQGGGGNQISVGFIFPELREIDGIYGARLGGAGGGSTWNLYSSGNSTNLGNGTWSTLVNNGAGIGPLTNYRDDILSLAASNVRCLDLDSGADGSGYAIRMLHVYGEISPGETPDRLLFIDEGTGLEFTIPEDWAEVPRGGSEDRTWRIKNNSASLTANTIQYTTEDLYLGSGAWYTHTLPGGATYQATQQVASLAAATTTGLITTRRITPAGEDIGLHSARTYLNVASWS